jgi:hypothetical protein
MIDALHVLEGLGQTASVLFQQKGFVEPNLIKNFCLLDEIILRLKTQIGQIEKEGTPLDKVRFFVLKEGIEILNEIASAHCGIRRFE